MIVLIIVVLILLLIFYSFVAVGSRADDIKINIKSKEDKSMTVVTSEQKKEYLGSYRKMHYKLLSLKEQRKGLVEAISRARAIQYSDMPKAFKKSDLSDYIVKLSTLIAQIDDIERALRVKRLDIEQSIINVSDGLKSEILRKRYIDMQSFEQIAIELGYTYRHTVRMHGWALQDFEIDKKMS